MMITLLLSAAFVLGMYLPAAAADWDFYGNARVTTFYTDLDEGDTTTLDHALQGNARVGATVGTDYIDGHFEYGASGGDANIRHLYGTFALGQGEMLVGHTWTPLANNANMMSTQVYGDDNAMDEFLGSDFRHAQVAYSIEGFTIALVEPFVQDDADVVGGGPANARDDGEVQLPQIQAGYQAQMDGMGLGVAAAFQTYDVGDDEVGDGDSLDAWILNFAYDNYMYDPVYFQVGGFYGQNTGDLGVTHVGHEAGSPGDTDFSEFAYAGGTADDIEDVDSFGVALAVGTDLNGVGVEGDFGYRQDDHDEYGELDTMGGYVNANIPVTADGSAFIVPEVGYYNYDDDEEGEDEDEIYGGLKWQVNF